MSYVKRFLEDISCALGFKGEINDEVLKAVEKPPAPETLPYPWCSGYPASDHFGKWACRLAGYCKRDPNCGE